MTSNTRNESGKVAFVADVHGQSELFKRAANVALEKYEVDRLVLVGDAIHRGTDSIGVLKTIQSLGNKVVYLAGNHEIAFAASHVSGYRHGIRHAKAWREVYKRMSRGQDIFSSLDRDEREKFQEVIRGSSLYYEDPGNFAVHAGLVHKSIQATKRELQIFGVDAQLHRSYYDMPQSIGDHSIAKSGHHDRSDHRLVVTGHIHHSASYYQNLTPENITNAKRLHIGAVEGLLPLLINGAEGRQLIRITHTSS